MLFWTTLLCTLLDETGLASKFYSKALNHERKVAVWYLNCQRPKKMLDNATIWKSFFSGTELKDAFTNLVYLFCAAVTIGASTATCDVPAVQRILLDDAYAHHDWKCELVLLAYEKQDNNFAVRMSFKNLKRNLASSFCVNFSEIDKRGSFIVKL